MSSCLALSVSLLLSLLLQTKSSDVQPSIVNETGEYYISALSPLDFSDQTIACSNRNCFVICNSFHGCRRTAINASVASSLIVECSDSLSCDSAHLLYGPSQSLSIICSDNTACQSSQWSSNDTTNARILCTNAGYSSSCHPCEKATFFLANAESVQISCIGDSVCQDVLFYVNYARDVSITANGTYALFSSTVQGLHAGNLDLFCAPQTSLKLGTTSDHSCFLNSLYVPSNFNLSCFGESCTKMGNLYVESSESLKDIDAYFNGCGVCDIASECTPQITIYCDYYEAFGIVNWNKSDEWTEGGCNSTNCGCEYMKDKMENSYFVDQSVCPIIDVNKILKMVLGVIIAIVCAAVCCCICICVGIYFACFKPRKPHGAGLLVGQQNVTANQQNVTVNQIPTEKYAPPQQAQVVVQTQPNTAENMHQL